MKQKLLRAAAGALAALMFAGALAGCSNKAEKNVATMTAAQFNDESYIIGVAQGAAAESVAKESFPKAQIKYFNRDSDNYLAVQQGKIDAFIYDRVAMEFAVASGLTGVKILPDEIGDAIEIAVGISPKSTIPDLQKQINTFLSELRADGTLDDMYRRWISEADDTMPDIPKAENPQLTIKVGTTGSVQPFSYYEGNQLTGYDIEMINRFAQWMNADVEIKCYDFDGIVAAAEGGAIDCILSNLNVTEERKQSIQFSDNIYESHNALMVKDDGTATQNGRIAPESARIGVMEGSTNEIYSEEHYPDADRQSFKNYVDSCAALSAGKLDYAMMDYTNALRFTRSNPDLEIASEFLTDEKLCVGINKNNPELHKKVSEVMDKFLADGTIDEAIDHWIKPDGSDYERVEIPKLPDAEKISVAIVSSREPTTFVMDGDYVGLDIEVIDRILYELGYQAEYVDMEWGAVIASIGSGKADMTLGMYDTPEREEKLLFTAPYFANPQLLVARKTENSTPVVLPTNSTADAGAGKIKLETANFGVMTGSTAEHYIKNTYPDATISTFPTISDGMVALSKNKIDLVMTTLTTALNVVKKDTSLAIYEKDVVMESIAIAVGQENTALLDKLNAILKQFSDDGTLDKVIANWTTIGKDYVYDEIPVADGSGGVLKVAVAADREPMCFIENNDYSGLDIELIRRIAYELGMTVEFQNMQFSSLVAALSSGKADVIISNMTPTEERRKSVNFTTKYFDNPQVFVSRASDVASAATTTTGEPEYKTLQELAGKPLGDLTGSTFGQAATAAIPGAEISYYNTTTDQLIALRSGKVEGILSDQPVADMMISQSGDVVVVPEPLREDTYGYALSKNNPLTAKFNAEITRMREDGTADEIYQKWVGGGSEIALPSDDYDAPNGTLQVACAPTLEPMCYTGSDGKPIGFDIEMIMQIAKAMGMKAEFTTVEFGSLMSMIQSGKADVAAGCICITEERKKLVDLTIPYREGGSVVLVRKVVPVTSTISTDGEPEFKTLQDLAGSTISVTTGTVFDIEAKKVIPDVTMLYQATISDGLASLRGHKADGIIADGPVCDMMAAKNDDVTLLPEILIKDSYGMALSKNNPLTAQLNTIIERMRADGSMEKLSQKWVKGGSDIPLPTDDYDAPNGILHVACATALEPMCYAGNGGKPTGFEVELMMTVAKELGMKAEFTNVEFSALMSMIQSGKADVATGCISITEERQKLVDLTTAYVEDGVKIVVRKVDPAAGGDGFFEGLKQSFIRTFVTEHRWKLVLDGLVVTVILSICSGVLGSVLGFGICMLRRSKRRLASVPAKILIRVVQGTPIVVLLMILYYIIFGSMDISAILVAILGFAVNFGVYVSEMIRTGIDAVDNGQIEAAHALGFTRMRTFWKITFPQAARHFLPVFKGEFISMVKMTSVVGYIAIQDLTKVSDIIRSRTLEAFFPLIATAILYFIVANLLTILLTRLEIGLDPKRRKRAVKGVLAK